MEFHSNRYHIEKTLKYGSYGVLYKGIDMNNGSRIALKCCSIQSDYKSAYRELCVLQHVNSQYLLKLITAHIIIENEIITTLWIVLPFMDYDLHTVLHEENYTFTLEANIKISYQILKGLQYLGDAGIIHRDLQPSKIGINRKCDTRIFDFGRSRYEVGCLSNDTQCTNYKAIEVFCGTEHTTASDIWSAGCIIVELFTKKILFHTKYHFNPILAIVKITGVPIENPYPILDSFRAMAPKKNRLQKQIEADIRKFVCHVDEPHGNIRGAENVIKLICSMLELDPAKRPNALHAMNSDLYNQYYDLVKMYPPDKIAKEFICDTEGYDDVTLQSLIHFSTSTILDDNF